MYEVDQERATCYHEAGHGVVAYLVAGYEVRYVCAGEWPECRVRARVFEGLAESWREAMYTLAGSFAEQFDIWGEIYPESFEDALEAASIESDEPEEGRGDHFELVECLADMGGDLESNYYLVVQDTEREVRRLWPEIAAVAGKLLENGYLDGDECVRVIESARHRKEEDNGV